MVGRHEIERVCVVGLVDFLSDCYLIGSFRGGRRWKWVWSLAVEFRFLGFVPWNVGMEWIENKLEMCFFFLYGSINQLIEIMIRCLNNLSNSF